MNENTVKLGNLITIKTGKKDVNQGNPLGSFPFFTCARECTYSDSYSFDTEALIIAGNGDVGHVTYYKGKFEAYQRVYVLSKFQGVMPEYLFLYLDEYLKASVSKQKLGNTMPYIKLGMLTDFEVPLLSLPEQSKVVSILKIKLENIEKAKEDIEKNLQNCRELFDITLGKILSAGWDQKRLEDVCERVEYGSSSKSKTSGKIPVLRMGNIQGGKFDWKSLVYTNDQAEIEKYALKHNDVLFNRTNSLELVGKTAIYKSEMPAIFAGYLIRIHRKENLLDADYLNYYLNSKMAFEYGKTVVISSVNQANINGKKLMGYPIPVPPLNDQKITVRKLDLLSSQTQKLESIYKQKLILLAELKKSILHKAFSGEL